MSDHQRQLWEASKAWCPDVGPEHPRRSSTSVMFQKPTESRTDLVFNLTDAGESGNPGFVSTYSFPRGHTDSGDNIPKIDTIFVDFDIPAQSEYRQRNHTLDAWKRSMSDLLIRVQMVAESLMESGKAKHWRASLSGHKGVHLFFDFDPIHPSNGTYTQFKKGLKEYGDGMIDQLDEIAGGINIGPWVDVDSSDLARLVRHPNTIHHGAEHTDDDSWCVPVTIEELTTLTPEEYLELTSGPRSLPENSERNPSAEARKEIALTIRGADGSGNHAVRKESVRDPRKVKEYQKNQNEDIEVADIPLLVTNKPCIMEFVSRDDAYKYGSQSRVMEIQVMKELIQKHTPIDVIVNFFRPIEGWTEGRTRDLVKDLISRYNGPFCCTNVWDDAPEFCVAMQGEQECAIYDRSRPNQT